MKALQRKKKKFSFKPVRMIKDRPTLSTVYLFGCVSIQDKILNSPFSILNTSFPSSFFLLFLTFLPHLMSGQSFSAGNSQITFVDADRNNRNIPTVVYYPADQAGTDVPMSEGAFHHIVFGHGFVMAVSAYQSIATALAEEGFIVLLPETEGGFLPSHSNFAQDLAFLSEHLLELNEQQGSFFYEKIAGRFAIGGHSMGGGSTYLSVQYLDQAPACLFTFAAAETNPSAIDQMSDIQVPNLMFSGELDCVTPPEDHQIPMYEAQSQDVCKYYIEITGGYHCQFNDFNFNCNFGESTCSPAGGIGRQEQIDLTLELLLPWLRAWLEKDCTSFDEFEGQVAGSQGFSAEFECEISPPGNPMIEIIGNMPACPGETLVLNAQDTQGEILWNTGETTEEIVVLEPGIYFYSLSGEVCLVVSPEVEVEFLDPVSPEIVKEGSPELCPGESVTLQTDQVAGIVEWSTGSNENEIEVTEEGVYSYTLEINGCQFFSEEVLITVIENPVLEVLAPQGDVLCPGDFLELSTSQGLNAVSWNTGDFETSIQVSEGGPYYYEGDWLGCTFRSDTIIISLDNPGVIELISSAISPACPGDTLTLMAVFDGSVLWSNGKTESEIIITEAGDFFFEAYTDFCVYLSDTFTLEIVSEIFPKVEIDGIPILCGGDSLLLKAERGDAQWNTGTTDSAILVTEPGAYFYSVSESNCLFFSNTLLVEEIEIAEIEIFSSHPKGICPGDSIVLSHSLGEIMVQWSTGDIAVEIGIESSGQYYFTAGDSICTFQSDTIEVVEISDPMASISHAGITDLCPGDTISLAVDGSFDAIFWNTGDTTPIIATGSSGVYFFEYIYEDCEFKSDSLLISAVEKPDFLLVVEGDSINCPGDSIWVFVQSEAGTVNWSNGSFGDSLKVVEAGSYSFSIELMNCHFQGDSIFVEFGELYKGVGITGPDTVEAGSAHSFEIEFDQSWQYEWDANAAEIVTGSMDSSVEIFFPEGVSGFIDIAVYLNDGWCIDTLIQKTIFIQMPVGTEELNWSEPVWITGPQSWRAVFKEEHQFLGIAVYDLVGRKLLRLSNFTGIEVEIPHTGFHPGLYLVVLKNNEGIKHTHKLIKL